MTKKSILLSLILFTTPVFAQTPNPPGGIALDQTFTDDKGKPVPDFNDQSTDILIMEPMQEDGLFYKKGDVVTEDDKKREVLAYAEARKLMQAIALTDPKCEKCKKLTLAVVLERATLARLCPQPGARAEKTVFCTPDEDKAENGVDSARIILGRQRFEAEIESAAKERRALVLDESRRDLLKKLVAGTYASQPLISAQALMMLDPNVQPIEFGKQP